MKYLKKFKLFESLYTNEIRDYIDDAFLELSEDHKYKVDIVVDEYIHSAPNTLSVIFGKNFVYPSDSEKNWGILPGVYNQDWKLGFLVKISCQIPEYADTEALKYGYWRHQFGRMSRKAEVKKKRELQSAEKKVNANINKVKDFIESKIKMIKRRCPEEIFLHGVKMEIVKVYTAGEPTDGIIQFDFAFIYQEFK